MKLVVRTEGAQQRPAKRPGVGSCARTAAPKAAALWLSPTAIIHPTAGGSPWPAQCKQRLATAGAAGARQHRPKASLRAASGLRAAYRYAC